VRNFDWRERSQKWYYFDSETGMIVGTVNKYALQEVWSAQVYTGEYIYIARPDDEKPLGQYIEQDYAKKAVENYWSIQSRTLLEESL
jgi:hypothetical protein